MRIGIIGAGAVGGTFAALLEHAGHEVEVTARGEQLAAIRAGGIAFSGGFGEWVSQVTAGEVLTRRPELAILATKAQDAAAALEPHVALLDGVPLLVVQNGLGGLALAHSLLPASPLIGGLALFAASYLEPGKVRVTSGLPSIVGAGPGCAPALLRETVAALDPPIPLEVTADIEGAQWTKLLINHVNALPAITGLSVQQVVADPRLRRIMTASMRESARIAYRSGARFATVQGTPGWLIRVVASAPLRIGQALPRLIARRLGAVPNPGSTLQSIRRGRRTEIDFLNGAVAAVAAEHGLTAPVNAALVALVHEVERTGVFLSPDDVVRRIPTRIQADRGA